MYHAAPRSAFAALPAVGLTAAAWASLIVVGVATVLGGLEVALAVALGQLCLLAIPAIAVRATGHGWAAIGLARPPAIYVASGLLIGVSAWYLNLRLLALLGVHDDSAVFEQLIDQLPLAAAIASIAAAPAICEEVLFRGVLLRGLATRFHGPIAIGLSALVFSAYHLNVVQLIPTFTLGCVLGVLALRAASSLPTMLAHFLNNTIAILVSRGELPLLATREGTGWFDRHPTLTLAGATALTTTGLAIAMVATCAPAPRSEALA